MGHPVFLVDYTLGVRSIDSQGKYEDADTFNLRAIAMKEKAFGPNAFTIAVSLGNRARGLAKQVRDGFWS